MSKSDPIGTGHTSEVTVKRGFIVHNKLYALHCSLLSAFDVSLFRLWCTAIGCLTTLIIASNPRCTPFPLDYSNSTVRKNNKRKLLTTNGYFSDPSGDAGRFPSHVAEQNKRFFPPLETYSAAEDR